MTKITKILNLNDSFIKMLKVNNINVIFSSLVHSTAADLTRFKPVFWSVNSVSNLAEEHF